MLRIIFKIAFRNVFRRKLQTYLLGLMISITTLAIFVMVGMQSGAFKLVENSYTSIFYGDIQVRNLDYIDKEEDFDKFVAKEDIKDIVNLLDNYKRTNIFYSKRAIHFALADANNKNYAFQLIGVVPEQEKNISITSKKIISGRYLKETDYNTILIGKDLADFFRLKVGDEITLMTTDIYDSFIIDVFNVVGIYQMGDIEMDKSSTFIHLDYFQDNIIYTNEFTNLTIKLQNSFYRDNLISQLQEVVPNNLKIISWDEVLPDIRQVISFQFSVSMFFYIILIAIIGFTILNALILSTIKRIPEFGVLNAIGLDKKYFKWLLFFENLIIATIFVGIASIIGFSIVYYFGNTGISLPSVADNRDRPLSLIENVIYPNIRSPLLLVGPILMYIFIFFAIIPAVLKLKKSNPIEAIRS